jgi:uncharacterized protein with FMN-binding domain
MSSPIRRDRQPSRLPIRGAIGLGVTAGGLAMLMSLKPPAEAGSALAFTVEPPDGTTALTLAEVAATAAPVPTAAATASASSIAGASPSVAPTATAAPVAATAQTAVGDAVTFRFGAVQVQVTVENGVITDITALQLPDGDSRSYQISQQVEPMLQSEALAAQSASIDTISGATYTSLAYAQSLQSALDRLA